MNGRNLAIEIARAFDRENPGLDARTVSALATKTLADALVYLITASTQGPEARFRALEAVVADMTSELDV